MKADRNPQGRAPRYGWLTCLIFILIVLFLLGWVVKVVLIDTMKHGLNQVAPKSENSSLPEPPAAVPCSIAKEELRCSSRLVLF